MKLIPISYKTPLTLIKILELTSRYTVDTYNFFILQLFTICSIIEPNKKKSKGGKIWVFFFFQILITFEKLI